MTMHAANVAAALDVASPTYSYPGHYCCAGEGMFWGKCNQLSVLLGALASDHDQMVPSMQLLLTASYWWHWTVLCVLRSATACLATAK
jgi:hypothetical protein